MIRPTKKLQPETGLLRRREMLAMLLGGALLPLLPAQARAANDAGAAQFISQLGQQVLAILAHPAGVSQREVMLRDLLRQAFDLGFIARFVLGRAYNGLSPEQAADYQDAFNDFVLRTYARRLAAFQVRGYAITGVRSAGDADSVVAMRIEPASGQPVACEWRVRESGQRFGIIDLALEGVSMAVTQRNEFASLVNAQGVQGLVSVLRARTDRETIGASR